MSKAESLLETMVEDGDIVDEYNPSRYDPDEFYENSKNLLSAYGYETAYEHILEAEPYEHQEIESSHLEVIAGLNITEPGEDSFSRNGYIHVRFVLEEGRPQKEAPSVTLVEDENDFSLPPGQI